ncbi:hypothetical protein NKR23_g10400 [Pleurostoma richardsiae]|uniref:Mid2 domain-containing protein n=1 Tax=Pleurostoma richardsiae TaxID=41990 RepID=A0AA38RA86_9PEZI|nr:hypothetical protein NKR23_g10400 [Pleurostoma richardsiae]
MPRSRRPTRAILLAAACSTTWASYIPRAALFERADSCYTGYSQCPQSGLPDNFCCPADTNCIALAANTTLVCCPTDSECSVIRPISCDLSKEDPEAHPEAEIKTTAVNGTLGHCGEGTCCPFGYSCNTDSLCEKDADQNVAPIQSTASGVPTSTAAASAASGTSTQLSGVASASASETILTPSPAETTTSAPAVSPTDSGSDTSGASPAVIAGSVIGGVLAAVLVGVLACVFLRRRQRKKQVQRETDPLKLTRSTSSFGNIVNNPLTSRGPISKPILASANSTMRSDFSRKTPQSSPGSHNRDSTFGAALADRGSAMSVSPPATPSPARLRDDRAAATGASPPRIPPIRNMRQSSVAYGSYGYGGGGRETPERGEREPSSLSINIFADPRTVGTPGGGRRQSSLTTFTDMMEQADLGGVRRGEPFVPGSALNSPARRR